MEIEIEWNGTPIKVNFVCNLPSCIYELGCAINRQEMMDYTHVPFIFPICNFTTEEEVFYCAIGGIEIGRLNMKNLPDVSE